MILQLYHCLVRDGKRVETSEVVIKLSIAIVMVAPSSEWMW